MGGIELSELLAAAARETDLVFDFDLEPEPDAISGSSRRLSPTWVTGISEDSRRVQPGDLFVALAGARHDGVLFAADAVVRGAVAVVGPRGSRRRLKETLNASRSMPVIEVDHPRRAFSAVCAQFYGEPTRVLTTIGVTGTNGKTTTAHMIAHLLGSAKTALISTVSNAADGCLGLTTPSSLDVQRIARQALDAGNAVLVVEASSIGLQMSRLADVWFDVAVWIGITPEHLGFHGDMRSYAEAKLSLVRSIGPGGICVLNAGDPLASQAEENCRGQTIWFGTGGREAVSVADPEPDLLGTTMTLVIGGRRVRMRLPIPAEHNVVNALAAAATAHGLGMSVEEIAGRLERFPPVPGRFEAYRSPAGSLVVVDYAHTPDALARVLRHLRDTASSSSSRLIAVFGCSGDADREKRQQMGRTAGEIADLSVITLDNPKFVSPDVIAADVIAGVRSVRGRYQAIADRRQAIAMALSEAGKDDVVLVAGKGHESHQIVGDRLEPYSDRSEVLATGCEHVSSERP